MISKYQHITVAKCLLLLVLCQACKPQKYRGNDASADPSPVAHRSAHSDPQWFWHADSRYVDSGVDVKILPDGDVIAAGEFGSFAFVNGQNIQFGEESKRTSFLARFGPNGALKWVSQNHEVFFRRLAVSADGSIFVVGSVRKNGVFGVGQVPQQLVGSIGATDAFVARYSPDGQIMWVQTAGGRWSEEGLDIVTSDDSSVVLVGTFYKKVTLGELGKETELEAKGSRTFLASYTSDGALNWAKKVASQAGGTAPSTKPLGKNLHIDAFAVTSYVNKGKHIFGAGEQNETPLTCSAGSCQVLAAYRGGLLQWAQQIRCRHICPVAKAKVLKDGSTLITGHFGKRIVFGLETDKKVELTAGHPASEDIFLARYDRLGRLLWAVQAGEEGDEYAKDFAVSNGYIYVTGGVHEKNSYMRSDRDAFVLAFDLQGSLLWGTRLWGHDREHSAGIDVSSGFVALTGALQGQITVGPYEPNDENRLADSSIDPGAPHDRRGNAFVAHFSIDKLREAAGTNKKGTWLRPKIRPQNQSWPSSPKTAWFKTFGLESKKEKMVSCSWSSGASAVAVSSSLGNSQRGEIELMSISPTGSQTWAKTVAYGNRSTLNKIGCRQDGSIVLQGTLGGGRLYFDNEVATPTVVHSPSDGSYFAWFDNRGAFRDAQLGGHGGMATTSDVSILGDDGIALTGWYTGGTVLGSERGQQIALSSQPHRNLYLARYDRKGSLHWAATAGSFDRPGSQDLGELLIHTMPDESILLSFAAQQATVFGFGQRGASMLEENSHGRKRAVAHYDRDGTFLWTGYESYTATKKMKDGTEWVWKGAVIPFASVLEKHGKNGDVIWSELIPEVGHRVIMKPNGTAIVAGTFSHQLVLAEGTPEKTVFTSASANPEVFLAAYGAAGELVWAKHLGGQYRAIDLSLDLTDDCSLRLALQFSGKILLDDMEAVSAPGEQQGILIRFDENKPLVDRRSLDRASADTTKQMCSAKPGRNKSLRPLSQSHILKLPVSRWQLRTIPYARAALTKVGVAHRPKPSPAKAPPQANRLPSMLGYGFDPVTHVAAETLRPKAIKLDKDAKRLGWSADGRTMIAGRKSFDLISGKMSPTGANDSVCPKQVGDLRLSYSRRWLDVTKQRGLLLRFDRYSESVKEVYRTHAPDFYVPDPIACLSPDGKNISFLAQEQSDGPVTAKVYEIPQKSAGSSKDSAVLLTYVGRKRAYPMVCYDGVSQTIRYWQDCLPLLENGYHIQSPGGERTQMVSTVDDSCGWDGVNRLALLKKPMAAAGLWSPSKTWHPLASEEAILSEELREKVSRKATKLFREYGVGPRRAKNFGLKVILHLDLDGDGIKETVVQAARKKAKENLLLIVTGRGEVVEIWVPGTGRYSGRDQVLGAVRLGPDPRHQLVLLARNQVVVVGMTQKWFELIASADSNECSWVMKERPPR